MSPVIVSTLAVSGCSTHPPAPPQGTEYTLPPADGTPVAMLPERVVHGDVKYRIARALDDAIGKAGVNCRFVLDSALVRVDQHHGFQPDALVYCGEEVDPNAVEIPNPVIVVEVLSPGNALRDLRDKLAGNFRLASIEHYLIADPDK